MVCGKCGQDNWDWVRKCSRCGTALAVANPAPATAAAASRKHAQEKLGRVMSDSEWSSVQRIQLQRALRRHRRKQRIMAPVRFIGEGTGFLVGYVLKAFLVGLVVYPFVLGLLWAYRPARISEEGYGGLFGAAWVTGFVIVWMWNDAREDSPRDAVILVWLGVSGALLALVVGAILKVV